MQAQALRASSAPLYNARASHTQHSYSDSRCLRYVLTDNCWELFVCYWKHRTDRSVTSNKVIIVNTPKKRSKIRWWPVLRKGVRIGCTRVEDCTPNPRELFYLIIRVQSKIYALANVYAYGLGHGNTLDALPPHCFCFAANYDLWRLVDRPEWGCRPLFWHGNSMIRCGTLPSAWITSAQRRNAKLAKKLFVFTFQLTKRQHHVFSNAALLMHQPERAEIQWLSVWNAVLLFSQ